MDHNDIPISQCIDKKGVAIIVGIVTVGIIAGAVLAHFCVFGC